jgi:hypothetical protein
MKTITHLDMSAFLAEYTAKVNAEHAQAEALREAVRQGAPRPVPTTVWEISDRH